MLNLILSIAVSASGSGSVFVTPQRADAAVARGAIVLDARGAAAHAPYVDGARMIDWRRFRDRGGRNGLLSSDHERTARILGAMGIDNRAVVIVYGDAGEHFGVEGRIWWMLRYLGLSQTYIIDGGIAAWQRAGLPLTDEPSVSQHESRFAVRLQPELRADARAVAELEGVLVDARTRPEFDGDFVDAPARGHISGAALFNWSWLLRPDGRLASSNEIMGRLAKLGISPDVPVIAYCAGGLRSAFLQAVLMQVGFGRVANYDGSMWDWRTDPQRPVALGK